MKALLDALSVKATCLRVMAVALVGFAVLAGCISDPAIIADLEEDKVIVQSGIGTTDGMIANEAQRGCSMHGRRAVSVGTYTCLDDYCFGKRHLFVCRKE